jgi:polyisoprenoid-binding protein YceI
MDSIMYVLRSAISSAATTSAVAKPNNVRRARVLIAMNTQRMIAIAAVLLLGLGAGPAAAQKADNSPITRYVVAPQGNEARYMVREQLAGINLPSDAVGTTARIEGGMSVNANGQVVTDSSRFTIDLASLKTDSDMRDGYVRRRTLQTADYPSAVFVPAEIRNLKFPLPKAGKVSFELAGDLTIRGVTRPVVWQVNATVANGSLTGLAKTQFTFADFSMDKPRVPRVLSVDDDIRLEYSFFLVAQ